MFVPDCGSIADVSPGMVIQLGIVGICLSAAAIMDMRTYTVYNYLWWIIGAAGVLPVLMTPGGVAILAKSEGLPWEEFICEKAAIYISLLIFILLQELFFCKMYGRADCHGFSACALVEAAFGMGMKEYLLHMLIAFGLLGVVQLGKRNIGRDGNLKQPVPFIPYLAVSFWLNLGAYLCV